MEKVYWGKKKKTYCVVVDAFLSTLLPGFIVRLAFEL